MERFTAQVTLQDGQKRQISDCVIVNGILCAVRKKGKGAPVIKAAWNGEDADEWEEYKSYNTWFMPYTNGSIIEQDLRMTQAQFSEHCKKVGDSNLLKDELVQKAGLRMGENRYGRLVENYDKIKEKEKLEKEQSIRDKKAPIEFGYRYGLRIFTRLPADVWAIVKPYATYQKFHEDDEDVYGYGVTKYDVEGWIYKESVVDVLSKQGFICTYRDVQVTSVKELAEVKELSDVKIKAEREAYEKKVKEIKEKEQEFKARFYSFETADAYDLCKSDYEKDEIRKLENLKVGSWTGATIYGGGRWFNVVGNDLYIVHNNGHDGDDWGRNNYGTGGAGAIGYKVIGAKYLFDEYKEWVESLGDLAVILRH